MQRFVCLSLTSVFLVTLLSAFGIAQQSPQQILKDEEKFVKSKPWRKPPPLKIKIVKTKKGEFLLNQKFVGGEDWFQGSSVVLENTSGKTITHVSVGFIFPREDAEIEKARPFYKSFSYGKHPYAPDKANLNVKPLLLKPGDTISITLSDSDYLEAKTILEKLKYIKTPKSLDFLLTEVYFDDGTGWAGGAYFDRLLEHSDKYPQRQSLSTVFNGAFNIFDYGFGQYKLQNIKLSKDRLSGNLFL